MWNEIWKWVIDNHIYQAAVVISILFLIFFPGRLSKALGKFKKVKAGSFELQADGEISPDAPCPYKKSRDESFGAIRKVEGKVDQVEGKVDRLAAKMREAVSVIKNVSIDQQKQLFYDRNQPDAERLAGGLKYICQGGNGLTKPDVIAFAVKHKDIYNALARVKPELRLARDQRDK